MNRKAKRNKYRNALVCKDVENRMMKQIVSGKPMI